MKSKSLLLIPSLVATVLFVQIPASFAQTGLLTFDDLTFPGLSEDIRNGYGGLQWNNFEVVNTVYQLNYGRNGVVNGMVSPQNVAFNSGGSAANFSDGTFNLNSAYLMAAWNDGLQVEVQGFVGTALVYDNTYSVGTQGSTLVNFNYLGVDKVKFISSGGVPHGYSFGGGTQFGMDNLSITLIPEPLACTPVGLTAFILILSRLIRPGGEAARPARFGVEIRWGRPLCRGRSPVR